MHYVCTSMKYSCGGTPNAEEGSTQRAERITERENKRAGANMTE